MYTMMQVGKETNMTYQFVKYSCNGDPVPNIKSGYNNHCVFDGRILAILKVVPILFRRFTGVLLESFIERRQIRDADRLSNFINRDFFVLDQSQ